MVYFENGNSRIYYEDVGKGDPIFTNHGLSEDCNYWSEPGVTTKLVNAGYRIISIDMRAHGRTRPISQDKDKGYDADTMYADFDALAAHFFALSALSAFCSSVKSSLSGITTPVCELVSVSIKLRRRSDLFLP